MTPRNPQARAGSVDDDFVTDAEIARRWRIGWKTARVAIRDFEAKGQQGRGPKFPPKDPLFGKRRYWPAVRAFLHRRYGVSIAESPPAAPDPKDMENFDEPTAKARRARHAGPVIP